MSRARFNDINNNIANNKINYNNTPLTKNNTDHDGLFIDVPDNCGIMIELRNIEIVEPDQHENDHDHYDKRTDEQKKQYQQIVVLHTAIPNENYIQIHPHCHGPAGMTDVRLLHGGGSGTAVFHGISNQVGDIVMKHASAKDAKEIFSLITIQQELYHRIELQASPVLKKEAIAAAHRIEQRIPIFIMVYISPYHLRDRYQELWASLRNFTSNINSLTPTLSSTYVSRDSVTSFDDRNPVSCDPTGVGNTISNSHSSSVDNASTSSLPNYNTENNTTFTKSPSKQKQWWTRINSEGSRTHLVSEATKNSNCTKGKGGLFSPQSPNNKDPVLGIVTSSTPTSVYRNQTSRQLSVRQSKFSKRLTSYEKQRLHEKERHLKRQIRLQVGNDTDDTNDDDDDDCDDDDDDDCYEEWESNPNRVTIAIPSNVDRNNPLTILPTQLVLKDPKLKGLQKFAYTLRKEMANHDWKVTIAQKTIGGGCSENGANALTSGLLRQHLENSTAGSNTNNQGSGTTNNPLLKKLVTEFCQLMEDLSTLTYLHESKGQRLKSILHEVQQLKDAITVQNEQTSARNENGSQHHRVAPVLMDYTDPITSVSKELNLFVGGCIHKNFDPIEGRFVKLRDFAADLFADASLFYRTNPAPTNKSTTPSSKKSSSSDLSSDDFKMDDDVCFANVGTSNPSSITTSMVFDPDEVTPAKFLALLLYKEEEQLPPLQLAHRYSRSTMTNSSSCSSDIDSMGKIKKGIQFVFKDCLTVRGALDEMEERGWLEIIDHATSFAYDTTLSDESKAAAMDCIWTCGLTDAGLHNLFVHVDRGLELFDLGVPGLEPQPAFLTKFLMSFFHTLGMQDDPLSADDWIRCFTVLRDEETDEEILDLTDRTKEMIPYIHDTFVYTVDYVIQHIFYGNERIRTLLYKYVVLQLLSDSAFCIDRWEMKGGGKERYGKKLDEPLYKWLWRSLWDQYIACYVYNNLLLPSEQALETK